MDLIYSREVIARSEATKQSRREMRLPRRVLRRARNDTPLILRNERGFTLAEMMVVLAIFLLMSGGIYSMMIAAQSVWDENKVKIDIHQNLRKVLEATIYDIRQTASSTITDMPSQDTWYTTITFKKPSTVTSGTIVWNSYPTKFQMDSTTNRMQKVENSITNDVATNITTLQFRRPSTDTDAIDVYVVAQATSADGRNEQADISFTVQMRN